MDHTQVHASVEIVDDAGKKVEAADSVNKVAKGITAWQAFRDYDWLHDVPVKNVAGDLRGMVLNKEWRAAFQFTIKAGKVMDFLSIAVGVAQSAGEIQDIVKSNDPMNLKAARLSTQVTAISMKYLTGIVTGPAHILLTSLPTQGYCDVIDLSRRKALGTCQQTLSAVDASIQSAAQQISDGNNIYLFVNTTIEPLVSRAMGF
jgi:hypothetical protein